MLDPALSESSVDAATAQSDPRKTSTPDYVRCSRGPIVVNVGLPVEPGPARSWPEIATLSWYWRWRLRAPASSRLSWNRCCNVPKSVRWKERRTAAYQAADWHHRCETTVVVAQLDVLDTACLRH